MHFHGSMVTENRPPLPGAAFSIASKNGRVLATGKRGQRVGQLAEIAAQRRRCRRRARPPPRRRSHGTACGSFSLPIDFAHRVAERMDLAAQRLALRLGDVELADGGQQQVVDVVHRVRDRRVRADERAFHAAGAQIGDELRHVAAEQALVLEGGAARRHEQAGARQDRRFGDGAVAERAGDDVVEVVGVEEARAGRTPRPRHIAAEMRNGARAGLDGRRSRPRRIPARRSRPSASPPGRRGSPPCCLRRPRRPWRRTSW